jgi:uncharacterized protein YndB with AHSA1/START domain
MSNTIVTVQTSIDAPIGIAWNVWTTPNHIKQWNAASDDSHTPSAENNLKVGGNFKYRMEAKDGSMGFDFEGEAQRNGWQSILDRFKKHVEGLR